MKFFKSLGIGLAAGCLMCSGAMAQDETVSAADASAGKAGIRAMFKNFDTDGDGKLSDAEKQAAMAQAKSRLKEQIEKNGDLKARLIEKFDADKDGALSDNELATAVKSKRGGRGERQGGGEGMGKREDMMKKFDADGDGKLSDTEKESARAEFITRMKTDMEKNAELKARLIEKFDANKDGALSDDELKTAAAAGPGGNRGEGRGEGMGKREDMMKKFDADGDGTLSDTEKAAAKAGFTAKIKSDIENNAEMKTRLLEKFDADKDGALSDSEITTMQEQGPPKGGTGGKRGEGMGGPGGGGRGRRGGK